MVKFLYFSSSRISLLSTERVTNINDYIYPVAGDLKLSGNTRIVNIGNGFGTRMGLAAHSLPLLLPLVLLLCYVGFYTMKCNNTKITFTVTPPPTPRVCLRVCTYPPPPRTHHHHRHHYYYYYYFESAIFYCHIDDEVAANAKRGWGTFSDFHRSAIYN